VEENEATNNNVVRSSDGGDPEAIAHLREAITQGKHWYIALLEAIGLWSTIEERHDERYCSYLVGGEAFDWLLLAERLCMEIDGMIPEAEKRALLFFGRPPLDVSPEEFKRLIGEAKYSAYLNFVYGVLVEEVLVLVIEEEVWKERMALLTDSEEEILQEVYRRIYGVDMDTLLRAWKAERGCPDQESMTLDEMKEFTYWLFQYRLKKCDRARVASDTKKALLYLQRHKGEGRLRREGCKSVSG